MSDWRHEAERKGGVAKTYSRRNTPGYSERFESMSLGRPTPPFRRHEGRGARMVELATQPKMSPRPTVGHFNWQDFPRQFSGNTYGPASAEKTPVRPQHSPRGAVSTGGRPESFKRRYPDADNNNGSDSGEAYRRPQRDTYEYDSPPTSPQRPYIPSKPRSPAKRYHPYSPAHRSPRHDQRRHNHTSPQKRHHTEGKFRKMQYENRSRHRGEDKENDSGQFRLNRRSGNEGREREKSRKLEFNRRSPSPKLWTPDLPSGLPNTHVQCYRNASLQALFGLEPLVQDLRLVRKAAPERDEDETSSQPVETSSVGYEKVLVELIEVLMAREAKDKVKLEDSLRRLNVSVARVSEKLSHMFEVDRMNDANEYLGIILNALSEAAKKKELPQANGDNPAASPPPPPPNSPDPASSDVTDPIANNFGFKSVYTLKCETCGKETVKEDTDLTTELHLAMPEEEEACGRLRDYFEEYFADETRERNCDGADCEGKVAKVRQRMSTLPRILLLNLKRYAYVDGRSHKNGSKVVIPKYLSVADVVSEKENLEPPAWERIPLSPMKKPSSSAPRDPRRSLSRERPGDCQRAMAESLKDYEKSVAASTERDVPEKDGELVEELPGSPMQMDFQSEEHEIVTDVSELAVVPTGDEKSPENLDGEVVNEVEKGKEKMDEGIVADDVEPRPNQGLRYRLVGVISHRGYQPNCGHYTADVYRVSEGSWYHFDDLAVSQREEREVLTGDNLTQGYIFFYMNENVLEKVGEGRALAGAMDLAEPLSP